MNPKQSKSPPHFRIPQEIISTQCLLILYCLIRTLLYPGPNEDPSFVNSALLNQDSASVSSTVVIQDSVFPDLFTVHQDAAAKDCTTAQDESFPSAKALLSRSSEETKETPCVNSHPVTSSKASTPSTTPPPIEQEVTGKLATVKSSYWQTSYCQIKLLAN